MHLIHDIRLVFISIRACIQEARQRSGKRTLPDELKHASQLVETGLSLVNELLVDRALKPIAASVDVNHFLEDLEGVVTSITGPDIAVTTGLVSGDTRVYAHRADLERILLNLAFNAAAAMPRGGSLRIETELMDDAGTIGAPFGHLLLTVRDDGYGMPEAQVARAIDPGATPNRDGSGIGLASVAMVLKRLGGKLAIESEPGSGTTVSIWIPLAGPGPRIH